MSSNPNPSEVMYDVVVNQEGQYSIWPSAKSLPQGWSTAGVQGTKAACLAHIGEAWTDMRPRSLAVELRH